MDTASFGEVCLVLQFCQMELSGWLKKNSTDLFACGFAFNLHAIYLMSDAYNFPDHAYYPPNPHQASSSPSFLNTSAPILFLPNLCSSSSKVVERAQVSELGRPAL